MVISPEGSTTLTETDRSVPCCPPGVAEQGGCAARRVNVGDENSSRVEGSSSAASESKQISFFAKYLTVWVALAMLLGTMVGAWVPSIPEALEKATVSNIWIPGAVLVWLMVYPMMLGVQWEAIRHIHTSPGGLCLTTLVNWALQPFLMYGLAVFFFDVLYTGLLDTETRSDYIAGAVILGGSPCTAMVFVWSSLSAGDPNYTLVQVILNDLILLFLYVPTTKVLLNLSDIALPWGTVFLSVVLFVVVPFALGMVTNWIVLKREQGKQDLKRIETMLEPVSALSLVLLVVFIFTSQANVIVDKPTHVLLVAIPLLLQTTLVFGITYGLAYFFCLPHNVAGPASFIGSSNFFELAVALALTVYGPDSGAVLVTVVGVLVEVPVMLCEVAMVNATKERYTRHLNDENCRCKKDGFV
eukprot:scaffold8050_cov180-Amphora_coffeaeformis.AAC.3